MIPETTKSTSTRTEEEKKSNTNTEKYDAENHLTRKSVWARARTKLHSKEKEVVDKTQALQPCLIFRLFNIIRFHFISFCEFCCIAPFLLLFFFFSSVCVCIFFKYYCCSCICRRRCFLVFLDAVLFLLYSSLRSPFMIFSFAHSLSFTLFAYAI